MFDASTASTIIGYKYVIMLGGCTLWWTNIAIENGHL